MTIRRLAIKTDNNNNVIIPCLVNLDYFLTYKNCILHLNVFKDEILSYRQNSIFRYQVGSSPYIHLLQKISLKPRLMNNGKDFNKVNVLRYNMTEPNVELCLEWISMNKIGLMSDDIR